MSLSPRPQRNAASKGVFTSRLRELIDVYLERTLENDGPNAVSLVYNDAERVLNDPSSSEHDLSAAIRELEVDFEVLERRIQENKKKKKTTTKKSTLHRNKSFGNHSSFRALTASRKSLPPHFRCAQSWSSGSVASSSASTLAEGTVISISSSSASASNSPFSHSTTKETSTATTAPPSFPSNLPPFVMPPTSTRSRSRNRVDAILTAVPSHVDENTRVSPASMVTAPSFDSVAWSENAVASPTRPTDGTSGGDVLVELGGDNGDDGQKMFLVKRQEQTEVASLGDKVRLHFFVLAHLYLFFKQAHFLLLHPFLLIVQNQVGQVVDQASPGAPATPLKDSSAGSSISGEPSLIQEFPCITPPEPATLQPPSSTDSKPIAELQGSGQDDVSIHSPMSVDSPAQVSSLKEYPSDEDATPPVKQPATRHDVSSQQQLSNQEYLEMCMPPKASKTPLPIDEDLLTFSPLQVQASPSPSVDNNESPESSTQPPTVDI